MPGPPPSVPVGAEASLSVRPDRLLIRMFAKRTTFAGADYDLWQRPGQGGPLPGSIAKARFPRIFIDGNPARLPRASWRVLHHDLRFRARRASGGFWTSSSKPESPPGPPETSPAGVSPPADAPHTPVAAGGRPGRCLARTGVSCPALGRRRPDVPAGPWLLAVRWYPDQAWQPWFLAT